MEEKWGESSVCSKRSLQDHRTQVPLRSREEGAQVVPEADPLSAPPPLIPFLQRCSVYLGPERREEQRESATSSWLAGSWEIRPASTRRSGQHPHLYIFSRPNTILISEASQEYLCALLGRAHIPQWVSVCSLLMFWFWKVPKKENGGVGRTELGVHWSPSVDIWEARMKDLESGSLDF